MQLAPAQIIKLFQHDLCLVESWIPDVSRIQLQLTTANQIIHRHAQNASDARNKVCSDSFIDPIDEIAQTWPVPTDPSRKTALCQRARWAAKHIADSFSHA